MPINSDQGDKRSKLGPTTMKRISKLIILALISSVVFLTESTCSPHLAYQSRKSQTIKIDAIIPQPTEYHHVDISQEALRITNQAIDLKNSLNYMKGRFQLALYGKFNRPDPMRDWDWLRPHTLNLYEYVGNDPVNAWDPDGFTINVKNEEALVTLKSMVPEELGEHIVMDDKNNVQLEKMKEVNTDDANFVDLIAIVEHAQTVEFSVAPNVTFIQDGEEVTIPFEYTPAGAFEINGTKFYSEKESGYFGNTATPTDVKAQSTNENVQVVVANLPSIVGTRRQRQTVAHELIAHAKQYIEGKPSNHKQEEVEELWPKIEDRTK